MLVEFKIWKNGPRIGINPEHVLRVLPAPLLFRPLLSNRTVIYLSDRTAQYVACWYEDVISSLNQADQTRRQADWLDGNGHHYFADRLSHAISEGLYQGRPR